MAENIEKEPLISRQSQLAAYALAILFLHSVAMFTLPFVAFFGVRHILSEYYPVDSFMRTVWSVVSAVVVVNVIIFSYAYKAYNEKEYDEHGNEIDQHSYPPTQKEAERSSLNFKQD